MSCTTAKRAFAFFEESPERRLHGHFSPWPPVDAASASASPLAAKRCRIMAPLVASNYAHAPAASAAAAAMAQAERARAHKHVSRDSDDDSDSDDESDPRKEELQRFLSRSTPAPLTTFLNRKQRKKMAMADVDMDGASNAGSDGERRMAEGHASQHVDEEGSRERLFTAREVEQIVQEAVGRREEELTQLFQKTLQEQLTEQFNQFSKFNEDFLHKRMEESTFSYMS